MSDSNNKKLKDKETDSNQSFERVIKRMLNTPSEPKGIAKNRKKLKKD